ncbi:hypothetical protein Bca101_009361 [Brassica carinata]
MSTKGEHHTVPLSVLLKRESANEKIDNPDFMHGQFTGARKGRTLRLLKQSVKGHGGWRYYLLSFWGLYFLFSLKFILYDDENRFWLLWISVTAALFDGHNGSAAAIYTKGNLLNNVLAAIPSDLNRYEWVAALPRTMIAGFVKTDKDFQERDISSV